MTSKYELVNAMLQDCLSDETWLKALLKQLKMQ